MVILFVAQLLGPYHNWRLNLKFHKYSTNNEYRIAGKFGKLTLFEPLVKEGLAN